MNQLGLPERCDVVVVGGGVLGLSSAWELSRRGLSVVVVERDRAGGLQSGRNLGFVRQQGRALAELPLMMEANRRWRSLGSELGADVGWQMGGNLRLTDDPALADRYERWAAEAAGLGLDSRVVSASEVRSILPVARKEWLLAIFTASDGQADPAATCRAWSSALRHRGVQVCEGVEVSTIATAGRRVTGVSTPIGDVAAGAVVLAAGLGSGPLARRLGLELPTQLVRQSVVLTEPVASVTRAACWTGDLFICQDARGCLRLAGSTRNEIDLDPSRLRHARQFLSSSLANRSQLRLKLGASSLASAALRHLGRRSGDEVSPRARADDVRYCLAQAGRYFPELGPFRLRRAWAGEIDATPDALGVIDAAAGPSGLVLATGMSGHGFGLSPAIGAAVAALVEGEHPGFDLKPFRYARFRDGSRLEPAHLL